MNDSSSGAGIRSLNRVDALRPYRRNSPNSPCTALPTNVKRISGQLFDPMTSHLLRPQHTQRRYLRRAAGNRMRAALVKGAT